MPRLLRVLTLASALLALVGTLPASTATAQVFSLDDNPSAPINAPFLPPFQSAEDPYGFATWAAGAGLVGPSPSLGLGFFDADGLLFGPALDFTWAPPVDFVNALSSNHGNRPLAGFAFRFSVDRGTRGVAGSAVAAQAGLNQQPADIYTTTSFFPNPNTYLGFPFGAACPTVLPSAGVGGGNVLFINQDAPGFVPLVPATVVAPAITPGSHDNVDAYEDWNVPFSAVGGPIYFSYPIAQRTAWGGVGDPAGIYRTGLGGPGFNPPFWASPGMIGLMPVKDDIDALLVFDISLANRAQGGVDYALFSLAPGSASLAAFAGCPGVSDGAVFFTDFRGGFAVFAFPGDLGLVPNPGGDVGLDALGDTPC